MLTLIYMQLSSLLHFQRQLEQPNCVPSPHRIFLVFWQIHRFPPVLALFDRLVWCIYYCQPSICTQGGGIRTDCVQTMIQPYLIDTELQPSSVVVSGSGDGDVVFEVVTVVLLHWPRITLVWMIDPVACSPEVKRYPILSLTPYLKILV